MKNKNVVLSALIVTSLLGCSATKDLSESMGSTGTGAVVGALVGVGAGVGCSKLSGSTATCVAAGATAGALAGAVAAELDEQWASTVPVVDCKGVSKKLAFKASKNEPVKLAASINLDKKNGLYKPGEEIKPSLNLLLASADTAPYVFKIRDVANKKESSALKKTCGGYDFPLQPIKSNVEGPQNIVYEIVDEKGKVVSKATVCASVTSKGVKVCK